MRCVILSAGVGSRLGKPFPKSLTPMADGRSILQWQLDATETSFGLDMVSIVVGFKKELIMEAAPMVSFIYNERFGETNTSKSLLKALQLTGDDPVLWLNGDVVFEPGLYERVSSAIAADESFVCVNSASVGEEEVKYHTDENGFITALSKTVTEAEGEAVGINFVSAADKPRLIECLKECADNDYFERGMELAIEQHGARFRAVDVGQNMCIEIDSPDDLAMVNDTIASLT